MFGPLVQITVIERQHNGTHLRQSVLNNADIDKHGLK